MKTCDPNFIGSDNMNCKPGFSLGPGNYYFYNLIYIRRILYFLNFKLPLIFKRLRKRSR